MLQHEGSTRTERHNHFLAGYLAAVAGFVNSSGFIVIGSFTSHVTGNIGRMADESALGHYAAAVLALVMAMAYFTGAFVASMAMEANLLGRRVYVYGLLLLAEAALIASFFGMSWIMRTDSRRLHDVQAMLLCIAMGLQNALVTRLSGAVVRTTHLTGVVTDLAIEAARWFRYWRASVGGRGPLIRLTIARTPAERPSVSKARVLLTIVAAFLVGSALGAFATVELRAAALWLPIVMLSAGGTLVLVRATKPAAGDGAKP